jgi:hypothetical protein
MQLLEHLSLLLADWLGPQLLEDRDQQAVERHIRVVEMNVFCGCGDDCFGGGGDLKVTTEDGGFADADFARDKDDAFSLFDPVQNRAQCLSMARTQEQIVGVGRRTERCSNKTVEISVHGKTSCLSGHSE